MKTNKSTLIFLITSISFLLVMPSSYAQKNVIGINPLGFLFGGNILSYERAIVGNSSGTISAGFSSLNILGAKMNTTTGSLAYRYYLNDVLRGFFAGLEGSLIGGNFTQKTTKLIGKFNGTNVSIFGGYQWIWSSKFSLSLNIGVQRYSIKIKSTSTRVDDVKGKEKGNFIVGTKVSTFLPVLGVKLGYAF